MKKLYFLSVAALLAVACTQEAPMTFNDGLSLSVSAFPQYSNVKTVGTPDEGKTSWAAGDALYLVIQTQSDSLSARYRLSYTGSGWNTVERYENGNYSAVTSIECPEDEAYRAEVFYAPSYEFTDGAKLALKSDLTPGLDEFLEWTSGEEYSLDGDASLAVSFKRNYSRLRVSAEALYTVKLVCGTFIPAGLYTSQLGGYTLASKADANANAFFYGSWPEGADISLMSYDGNGVIAAEKNYCENSKSVDGNGYAVYCTASSGGEDDPDGGESGESIEDEDADDFVNESEFTKVITVTYSGTTATVSPENILTPIINGAHVVLGDTTSSVKNVKVSVSGTTTDGSLKIYNQKKMLLALSGASVTSTCGPAINNQCGKRLYVTLSGSNSLSDASSYTDTVEGEDSKACLFSEAQMIFSGDGSLSVKGNYKHAIASDDYVRVLGGTISVTGAASDAIKVNDYYRQDAGTVTLNSTGDAIQCDDDHIRITGGKLTANTSGEKGSGLQATGDIIISGGTVNSTVTGNGSKCIKTDANVTITGGTVTLKTTGAAFYDTEDQDVSSPACIRAENTCTLEGGTVSCTSTGKAGKGINAYIFRCNEGADLTVSTSGGSYSYNSDYSYAKGIKGSSSVEINGGTINVTTTGSGAEGIESKGNLTVNGGKIYIKAYDDAINAAGQIIFKGGYTFAYSTNNDAIDSNYGRTGAISFNGGVVMAQGAREPEEGIDADNDAYLTFAGGTVFSSGGKQNGGQGGPGGPGEQGGSSPSCSQSTILLGGLTLSTGYFTVTDSNSKVIFSCYVPRSMSQDYSFVSSPLLTSGTIYKYGMASGAPSSPSSSWENLYYEGGTASVSGGSFTANGSYQSSGGSGGEGGGGEGGGGHRPW